MGKEISRVLSRPVYPYLYGCAFIVFKSSAYFESFEILPAVNGLFLFSVISYLLVLFFGKISDPACAGISTVIVWTSLFHVVGVAQLFHYPYAYIPVSFYVYFYFFVLLILFFYSRFSLKVPFLSSRVFNQIVNIFLIMCCIVFFFSGTRRVEEVKVEAKQHYNSQAYKAGLNHKKDIVWILMDEYGSSGSLNEQFSFENPIDSLLEKEHFCILKNMHSRYNNTLFSVNSIFNNDDSIVPSSYYKGIDLLRHGSLIPALENSGHRFVNLGFFDMAEHPMIADRSGYPYTYLQQLFSGTLFDMLYRHWESSIKKCDNYSMQVLRRLTDTLSQSSPQPRFIWAHMTIPHPPFCRNASGQIQKDTVFGANDSGFVKRAYLGYLQYGNSVILSLLKQHPDLSEKIVIITGDHGPRFPFLTKKEYQYWPFAAIHMPERYDSSGLEKLAYISQLPGFLLRHLSESTGK